MKKYKSKKISLLLFFIIVTCIGFLFNDERGYSTGGIKTSYEISNIPNYNGEIYVTINNNIPKFTKEDVSITKDYYSNLESGKCGVAMVKTNWKKANDDEKKDNYSAITPSGFVQKQYDANIVPGKYLYHRCHLIGWSIGGIDVDKRNLMTGTRDFNIKGMKSFEDKVYNYLRENQTNNVLYRVTPYFEGNNKLANGVNIEAYSIEDNGGLQFNVYVYNVQDGIVIDYATGESKLAK